MNLSVQDVVVLLPVLLPLAGALYQFLISKLPQDKQYEVENLVHSVVKAVEQQADSGQITPDQRKTQALTSVNQIVKDLGLSKYVSPTLVDVLIESAVANLPASTLPAQPNAAGLSDSVPAV